MLHRYEKLARKPAMRNQNQANHADICPENLVLGAACLFDGIVRRRFHVAVQDRGRSPA